MDFFQLIDKTITDLHNLHQEGQIGDDMYYNMFCIIMKKIPDSYDIYKSSPESTQAKA